MDEQRKSEQSVDDGRNARQVSDVYLDELGQTVLRGILFQVDGGPDTDRNAEQGCQAHEPEGAEQGGLQARLLRESRREVEDELRPEPVDALQKHLQEQHAEADDADRHGGDQDDVGKCALELPGLEIRMEPLGPGNHSYFNPHFRTIA